MSQWLPPTPNSIPRRTLTALGRLTVAGRSAQEAVNALIGYPLPQKTPQQQPQKNPWSFTQTKTNMKYKKPAKSKLSAVIRKEIAKTAIRNSEIKNASSGNSTSLLHNQIQGFGVTQRIVQGTNSEQRLGDEMFLESFRMEVIIGAPTTAGAYAYRLMVVYSGEEYSSTTFSTSTLSASEIFLPNITTGTRVSGVVNKKAVQVLYDHEFVINSNITGVADVYTTSAYINLRKYRFQYQAGGSTFGKLKNLYVIVIPNVQGGTLDTTGCGSIVINNALDYRDP